MDALLSYKCALIKPMASLLSRQSQTEPRPHTGGMGSLQNTEGKGSSVPVHGNKRKPREYILDRRH